VDSQLSGAPASLQADRSVLSAMSGAASEPISIPQHTLQFTLASHITTQQAPMLPPERLGTVLLPPHPLHTHSNSQSTTNISLYPPPNPLAKPILPNTPGLARPLLAAAPPSSTCISSSQPSQGGRAWTHKNSANHLAGVNERTVPAFQVRDLTKRPTMSTIHSEIASKGNGMI